jgi:hypothetical protein
MPLQEATTTPAPRPTHDHHGLGSHGPPLRLGAHRLAQKQREQGLTALLGTLVGLLLLGLVIFVGMYAYRRFGRSRGFGLSWWNGWEGKREGLGASRSRRRRQEENVEAESLLEDNNKEDVDDHAEDASSRGVCAFDLFAVQACVLMFLTPSQRSTTTSQDTHRILQLHHGTHHKVSEDRGSS